MIKIFLIIIIVANRYSMKKTFLYFKSKVKVKVLWFQILYYFGFNEIYYLYQTKIKIILFNKE